MPRRRYQPPKGAQQDDEGLPLHTQLTILTRQSTLKQATRNVQSDECNPQDLVREARRLGFTDIQVYDWDTGIGAYSTTIEDRPALRYWLNELLPNGKSRVLMVSQEDRLFRDKWEDQHNAFIRKVATYGGWVICGLGRPRIYDFRQEMHCEQFRQHCKSGKFFIEDHIIRRMLPALHRVAMRGEYAGSAVPWGYVVDYDRHSPSYRRFIHYEPHAVLVGNDVFQRFAGMARPSVSELERQWYREGLVWPFFGPDIDERRVRRVDAHCKRDEVHGGYVLTFRMAQIILSNVAYLGWQVRARELAREDDGQPRICHEPLVDAELFWWCYDRIAAERPEWADGWAPSRPRGVVSSYRPRLIRSGAQPSDVRFVAPGRVRCAMHGKAFSAITGKRGHIELHCGAAAPADHISCARIRAEPVETALCQALVEQLVLNERDIAALAQIAQRRQRQQQGGVIQDLERQLAEQRRRYDRAKLLAFEAPDLAADVLEDFRRAKREIQDVERRLDEARAAVVPSPEAWQLANQAVGWAERIRATFLDWPRESRSRVVSLALDDAVLGWVSKHAVGVWMCWQGGTEVRREIVRRKGKVFEWTAEEEAALRRYYGVLTREALQQMFPARTIAAIELHGARMGLTRPGDGGHVRSAPEVFPGREVPNVMAAYGFPLGASTSAPSDTGA